MPIKQIPLESEDVENWRKPVQLQDDLWIFDLFFSPRSNAYYIDVELEDGTKLIEGQRITLKTPINRLDLSDDRLFDGILVCFRRGSDRLGPPVKGELSQDGPCSLLVIWGDSIPEAPESLIEKSISDIRET